MSQAGRTALDVALARNDTNTLEALLKAGASPDSVPLMVRFVGNMSPSGLSFFLILGALLEQGWQSAFKYFDRWDLFGYKDEMVCAPEEIPMVRFHGHERWWGATMTTSPLCVPPQLS